MSTISLPVLWKKIHQRIQAELIHPMLCHCIITGQNKSVTDTLPLLPATTPSVYIQFLTAALYFLIFPADWLFIKKAPVNLKDIMVQQMFWSGVIFFYVSVSMDVLLSFTCTTEFILIPYLDFVLVFKVYNCKVVYAWYVHEPQSSW